MKHIKKLLIILLLVSSNSSNAKTEKDNILKTYDAPFVGIWEWENGNQTFRVKLYIEKQLEDLFARTRNIYIVENFAENKYVVPLLVKPTSDWVDFVKNNND
ncbi:DUF6705 family protein [Kordia sp.]|uniref:DUF6705 family protein n=1 Tax=Kordia sp. TaxID=1965332 RepID=UPI003D2C2830